MQKQLRLLLIIFDFFISHFVFAKGIQDQKDQLKNQFPYAIISTESNDILNRQDLEISSCGSSPEAFSENSISYPYWQCLPTKLVTFNCNNKNKDGSYSKHETLLFININDVNNKAIYVARRAMEHKDCILLKRRWLDLTSNEPMVCLSGLNAGLNKETDGTMTRTWVFDKFKTKKGCESYFEGYCDLKYLKSHNLCKD